MIMPETAKSWSYEDLVAAGLDPERCEIVDGESVEKSDVGMKGGWIWGKLVASLANHVEEHGLGRVVVNERFVLSEKPRKQRRPDIAFVTSARAPDLEDPEPFHGAADLAIEILSPTDPIALVRRRLLDQLEAGAQEGWIVDSDQEIITVHSPGRPARPYGIGDTLQSPKLLPGFALSLEALFALPKSRRARLARKGRVPVTSRRKS